MGEGQNKSKQLETVITIYSLLILGMIMMHEFCACCIPNSLKENFKIITFLSGKGIIFILISILFLNPLLGNQQEYSAYLLLSVGILCILADFKFDKNEEKDLLKTEIKSGKINAVTLDSNRNENNADMDVVVDISDTIESKPVESNNPYDIPDDF